MREFYNSWKVYIFKC